MTRGEMWEEVLLDQSDSIEQAVAVLESTSLQIVLVVDKNRILIGTVTDGDIRRGIIRRLPMNSSLEGIMNNNPLSITSRTSRETILSLMRAHDVLQVPVVDDSGVVVGLEIMQELLEPSRIDNPVVIMAGGFGKRLRPLTNDVPKPMLKVAGKPILESTLEQFIESGFHNFYFSVHYKSEVVKSYFEDGYKWGVEIKYLEEEKPLGTAGCLSLLPQSNDTLPILVMNGDVLTTTNFPRLLEFHRANGCMASVCVREYDLEVRYGVVKSQDDRITELIEKPVEKYFVNAGIYVLDWELINYTNAGHMLDMTDLLNTAILDNKIVSMYPIHEKWLDIGAREQYEEALLTAPSFEID